MSLWGSCQLNDMTTPDPPDPPYAKQGCRIPSIWILLEAPSIFRYSPWSIARSLQHTECASAEFQCFF